MRTVLNRLTHHMRNPYVSHALTLPELAHHMRKAPPVSAGDALVRAVFGVGVTHHMRSFIDLPGGPGLIYRHLYGPPEASGRIRPSEVSQ